MTMEKLPVLLLSSLFLGACAGKTLPATAYNSNAFRPAVAAHDPAPLQAVPVAEARPLPTPLALSARPKADPHRPIARVKAANTAALQEPTADGYLEAVQIYPFVENALYRLYAAPGQVSDIALQPGETLTAISAGDTVRWAVGDTASGSGQTR